MILNELAQGLRPVAEGVEWFGGLSEDDQRKILHALVLFSGQARACEEDVPESIARSGLRPTHTPVVMLTKWRFGMEIHEERDLKGRAEGETRTVPGHPALSRILRQHIEDEQLKPGDLLFQGEAGGILTGSVIRRAWRSARKAVLPPHVFESPTGKRVYDNRHTRLTKWLNDGIPPAQVAE
ncbi:DUF5958 family protein [Streptomyces sp. NPDC058295]|uniref:DUF5958 family protein n=1 Tax=Streptomyces sp. NPDC058295 TaxID=3346431 RepID=UPI0036E683F1